MIYQVVNIFLTEMYLIYFKNLLLRSDMSDYSDAYIVVKVTITVEGDNNAKKIIIS